MVGEDGAVRVLDFGIARAAVWAHATREGEVKGKLRYIAPEQLRGATARGARTSTPRASCSGARRRSLASDSDAAIYGQVLEGVVKPPSDRAVPSELDGVLWALARDLGRARQRARETRARSSRRSSSRARGVAAWLAWCGPVARAAIAPRLALEAAARSRGCSSRWIARAGQSTQTATQAPPEPGADHTTTNMLQTSTLSVSTGDGARGRRSLARPLLAILAVVAFTGGSLIASRLASRSTIAEAKRGLGDAALIAALRVRAMASTAPSESPPQFITLPDEAPTAPRLKGTLQHDKKTACVPPYYVDDTGIRRVKRECL